MPVMRKLGGKNNSSQIASKSGLPPEKKPAESAIGVNISLPETKSKPKEDIRDYTWLIHGEPKIGKTSLASQFDGALILFFEPGGKGLEVFSRFVGTWAEFKQYIKLLRETPSQKFRTIVIDTVDIAYKRCFEYVAKREGFEHPNDMNDFGKSWNKIKDEFSSAFDLIASTGRGLLFISHTESGEFQTLSGGSYNKLIPSMPKQAREYIRSWVDITGYYGYYGENRFLTIRGSDGVDAGHRVKKHFLTTSGERLHSIPMGKTEEEGYANIIKAFNNQQKTTGEPKAETGLSETRAVRKPRGK